MGKKIKETKTPLGGGYVGLPKTKTKGKWLRKYCHYCYPCWETNRQGYFLRYTNRSFIHFVYPSFPVHLWLIIFLTVISYHRKTMINGCFLCHWLIPTIIRIISYSSGLCRWYMANVVCLLLNNLSGFSFYFGIIGYIPYVFIATGLSCLGIICFLVFRIFYRITDEVCLRRTGL